MTAVQTFSKTTPLAKSSLLPILVVAIALLLSGAVLGGGGMGHNKELYVVPAPETVEIDGSLKDWDFSGHVPLYVAPQTRETRSADIAMMYDDKALYIGGRVRDNSPMMNRHDPLTKPSRAWDADVCQIFFSLDPDEKQPLKYSSFKKEHKHTSPVATMMLWYFTDRKQPSLAMFQGMGFGKALRPDLHKNGHIPSKHFDAAFKKGQDGLSYTFEYRIPWKTFQMKRIPKAKDTLAAAMAVFWSRPDGLKTAGGSAWAWNVMSKGGFPYQSTACWGTLRFHPEGNIPREWVEGDIPPEQPLPLTFKYELPREGETTIQLFDENNESVRILVAQEYRPGGINTESWDGLDKDGKPLPAGKYAWRGVVHDKIKMKYRFSVHNSGNPPYPTDDNTGGWGADHGRPTTALALEDGMILAWSSAEYGWGIIRVDLDGQKKWGSKRTAQYLATDGERLFTAGGHGWSGGSAVKVISAENSRTLNFQPGQETLPPPKGEGENKVTGLACNGERIYASYGKRNLIGVYDLKGNLIDQWKVSSPGRLAIRPDGSLAAYSGQRVVAVDDGKVSPLIDRKLEAPRGIAVDRDGTIYVAQAGNLQQVRAFSPSGKLLRSIGKKGGRPAKGKFNPKGMYQPGGIDIDVRNRLWVAETAGGPKRISVWDGGTGKYLDQYFGSSGYFAYGHIDPARPDEIYANHVLWGINWDNYETHPKTTVWRKTSPNMMPPVSPSAYISHPRMITADDGHQYMYGRNLPMSIVLRRDGELFKPFVATIEVGHGGRFSTGLPLIDENPDRFPNATYLWQDANNDQCVQAEELEKLPGKRRFRKIRLSIDKQQNLYMNKGYKLEPVKITDKGQPVYDFEQAEKIPVGHAPYSDGYVYPGYGAGTIARIDPANGDKLWRYTGITRWKSALEMGTVGPGKLWGTTGLMGVAGNYVAYMTYFGVNHVFLADEGTYLAALLQDGRTTTGRGPYEGQPEGQGGSFVKLNIDGKDRYFVIHGGQDSRVWEVLGLDSVQKLRGGTYTHKPEQVATARKALEKWEAAKAGKTQMVIHKGRNALDEAEAVTGSVDDNRQFEARMAYDEDNLYVRFDVNTKNALTNSMPEKNILFRGGNCLDIQIATDPEANPDREEPAPGDLRLLVTRQDGKPFAVMYRPEVKGFNGEPIVLDSPTGQESFDSVEVVKNVGLDYSRTDDGFTATVTVPLDLIGLKLQPGATVTMDLGYVFGNSKGSRASARAYLNNNSFSANVTDDIPNESRLEPDQWATATVK